MEGGREEGAEGKEEEKEEEEGGGEGRKEGRVEKARRFTEAVARSFMPSYLSRECAVLVILV